MHQYRHHSDALYNAPPDLVCCRRAGLQPPEVFTSPAGEGWTIRRCGRCGRVIEGHLHGVGGAAPKKERDSEF